MIVQNEIALAKGFIHVESGPMVGSSYHAGEQFDAYRNYYGILTKFVQGCLEEHG